MAVQVRVSNPGRSRTRRRRGNPSSLFLVNGGRKMARRRRGVNRRRTVRRRRNPVVVVAPRRRVNRRRRRSNPRRRRYGARRQNPQIRSMLTLGLTAAVGAILTDVIQGFVPFTFGGPWGKIGVRVAVAYLLGWGAERFVSPITAQALAAGGVVGAAQDAFRLAFGGLGAGAPIPTVAGGAPVAQLPAGDGISDIINTPQWSYGW